MIYQIKHKLTGKMVRNTKTFEVLTFSTKEEAQEIADMKNRIMHADWYEVVAV